MHWQSFTGCCVASASTGALFVAQVWTPCLRILVLCNLPREGKNTLFGDTPTNCALISDISYQIVIIRSKFFGCWNHFAFDCKDKDGNKSEWVPLLTRITLNISAAISHISAVFGPLQHMTCATISTSVLQSGQRGVWDSLVICFQALAGAQHKWVLGVWPWASKRRVCGGAPANPVNQISRVM